MLRQVQHLACDLSENLDLYDHQARLAISAPNRQGVSTVYLVGCGDSLHAGYAARMAFHTIAGVKCIPVSAQEFVGYSALQLHRAAAERVIVICTSASGITQRVVEAIEHAKAHDMLTVAITGNPDSPAAMGADASLIVALRHTWPSPGVRTFQASLMGMLLLAISLGEMNVNLTGSDAAAWRNRLARMAPVLETVRQSFLEPCAELSKAISVSPTLYFLGSGPSLGTALFSAAKMVEVCGVFSVAQDIEEWWHVERFAYPVETPICIIAPPGASQSRALRLAEQASQSGRHVILVTAKGAIPESLNTLPCFFVPDDVCEEFSPLVYSVFGSLLSHFTAARLGRGPFQTLE